MLALVSLLMTGCTDGPEVTPPTLEYIGHAAFVFESPTGVRIAIDPFNSERWLGYVYPDEVTADAVLVTHPHYDHDAAYYFPSAPAFRHPGVFTIGDVRIEGHKGRHADPYGREFGQTNTVWILEAGGVRLAHFGDNGPPDQALIDAVGRVDVLLIPSDGQDHILAQADIKALRAALSPRLTIPMHYRLDGFHGLPASLGPLDADGTGTRRVASHRLVLDAPVLDGGAAALAHHPGVRPWGPALAEAWQIRDAARAGVPSSDGPGWRVVADGLRQAAARVPEVLVFRYELADALARAGDPRGAIAELERALTGAHRQDTEYATRARARLAQLYAATDRQAEAEALYRVVLAGSTRLALLEQARQFLQ